jgi:hypothetical protein
MTDPAARPLAAPSDSPEVRTYCDQLLMALRMREVPGQRIGEILTEVRAHLAEGGEDPVAVFGDPEAYAADLSRDQVPKTPGERLREGLVGVGFGLGGWWLADGVSSVATGDRALMTPLPLVGAALALIGGPWLLEQLVSSSRARMLRGALTVTVALTALAGLDILLDDRIGVPVPAAVPLVLGLLCLGAATLALRGTADPVVDPFEPLEAVQARRRRDGVLINAALWGWLVLLVAVAAAAAVLVDRLG